MTFQFSRRLKLMLAGLLMLKMFGVLIYLGSTLDMGDWFSTADIVMAQENESGQAPADGESGADAPPMVSPEELKSSLKSLEDKRLRLKAEELRIEQKRAELNTLKQEVTKKIEALAEINSAIEASLAKKEQELTAEEQAQQAAEEAKLRQLVKVYTSMKARTAAELINNMDLDVTLKLFSRMKGEEVGAILSYVEKRRAAKISEMLAPENGQPE
ncbi:MAG: hypothetical protein SWH61_15255 [Thermodesulfobacteriota bacterium]|nr:hypothetical protein [Thermodesulfobacteriota bacterium]